jgi:NADH-quinone oxidoreductase subunit M
MLPLVLFIFWIGFYPNTFLEKMNPSIDNLINQVKEKQHVAMMVENLDQSVTKVTVNE